MNILRCGLVAASFSMLVLLPAAAADRAPRAGGTAGQVVSQVAAEAPRLPKAGADATDFANAQDATGPRRPRAGGSLEPSDDGTCGAVPGCMEQASISQ